MDLLDSLSGSSFQAWLIWLSFAPELFNDAWIVLIKCGEIQFPGVIYVYIILQFS